MNRWLETDTQKTARNIINVLNESAAGMVKKEINKDKPEEAPKNKKVALEKRVTKAAIKGKKPESKNAKMPKKIAKKVVKEELEPETEKSIEDQIADLQDYLNNTPEIADDEKEAIQAEIAELENQLAEDEVDNKIMNESAPGTDAYDKLVQGDDVYFRNEEGVALLGHYADNYPEPEEYDDGFKPEYGGTEEGLQKAKEAAANRDVWEFMEVFEDTLQPMNEVYAYVYGQDDLMEMLKTLRQVNVVKKLEENQIEDARKDSIEKGLISEEESEFKVGDVVKVPYKYGSYTPGEFTEAPIIDIEDGRYVTVEIPSKLEVTMDQLRKWNTLEESDNEPKTVKEYRIMDGNKVLKTFSADERSKGYAEMRAMGKALKDAGKEDNLIYKEFTVKNKLKEEYSEKRLNEEDTFEELIPEEDEDVEKMYDVISYYDDKLKGIEDSITSNDWSVITDFAHNKLMNGSYVKIVNTVSGKEKVITPSTYQDEFNGEFTIKPEGLTEAEDVQSELDDMKEQLQESDKNKLKEEYSEKFGGDPKDFIGDLISVKHQLSKLNLDGFGSHLARQMVEDFIDTCDRQIKKQKD